MTTPITNTKSVIKAEPQNQLATRQMLASTQDADAYLAQIKNLQKVVQSSLIKGHDYVNIAGRDCLAKPGAEKIFVLLGVACSFDILDTKDSASEVEYMIRCNATYNGTVVAQGLGLCSSREKKYAKQSVADIKNTVLKMAEKRAKVDCALHIGALSDIFTQDLDDVAAREEESVRNQEEIARSKPASAGDKRTIEALFINLGIDDYGQEQKLAKAFKKSTVEELTHYEAQVLINKMRTLVDEQPAEDIEF